MSIKDLFRFLIKLFGFYLLISAFFTTIPAFLYVWMEDTPVFGLSIVIIAILLGLSLFSLLVFFPDKVIQWFQLDKGFDNQQISIQNIETEKVIRLLLLLIGVYLICTNVSTCILQTIVWVKRWIIPGNEISLANSNEVHQFLSFLNLIIGYILIRYRLVLTTFFLKGFK